MFVPASEALHHNNLHCTLMQKKTEAEKREQEAVAKQEAEQQTAYAGATADVQATSTAPQFSSIARWFGTSSKSVAANLQASAGRKGGNGALGTMNGFSL